MKKSISAVLAAILLITATAFAQPAKSTGVKVVNLSTFEKITVNAQIDIELVQNDKGHEAWFQGSERLADLVILSVSGNELIVDSKYPRTNYKGKLTLSIPVTYLSALQVNSSSVISTVNVINAPQLFLTINSECEVKLQTNGKIVCNAIEPYDYGYEYRMADRRMSVEAR